MIHRKKKEDMGSSRILIATLKSFGLNNKNYVDVVVDDDNNDDDDDDDDDDDV